MTAVVEKRRYTYEDYLNTPDELRYELLEGDLIVVPSPATRHQRVLIRLISEILRYVMDNKLGEVFAAPYDVCLDDENVVQPDILFISKERVDIIGEKNVHGAPDLVIEILSETTVHRDTIQKKELYAKFGVKEYWIVAPDDKLVEVYHLKEKGEEFQLLKTYSEKGILESQIIRGLKVYLESIFT